MFKKIKKSKSNQGFTIIEVMIVLAIAALILLIVFLAVPALQRSSRNTQRKTDASNIAALVSNYVGDNSGTLPSGFNGATKGQIQACTAGGVTAGAIGTGACGAGNTENGKIGYFTSSTVFVNAATSAAVINPTVGTVGSDTVVSSSTALIVLNEACPLSSGAAPVYTADDAAVFYATETGSGNGSLQCTDS